VKLNRAFALLSTALLAVGCYTAGTASAGAPYSCTQTGTIGRCGPYNYPAVQGTQGGTSGGEPYVDQNEWGQISGETQTLYANSPGDWMVTNKTPANSSGSVTTYPNTGAPFNEQPLSKFPVMIGSFSESMPHTAGTSAWATYDNWFDDWNYEVMIQNDFVGNGPCDYHAVVTFGGSNGVPAQLWGLCTYGSELIWKLAAPGSTAGSNGTVNESSGSVDIKAMIMWLVNNGYMTANPTVTNISYGWEISSTNNTPQNFIVSSYSLTTSSTSAQQAPAVTTGSAASVTGSGATLNGTVNAQGASTTYRFDYGTTNQYGSTTAAASAGTGTSSVNESAALTGLAAGTTYHYRIEATNSGGTTYGTDAMFTTSSTTTGTPLVGDSKLEATVDGSARGRAEAFSYVAAGSGTSTTARFYVDRTNAATGGVLGIYADSGWNSPGRRLAQAGFSPVPGWNTVTLSGAQLVAGRQYWLAVVGTGGQIAFRCQGSGSKDEESRQSGLTTLPSSWSDGTAWNSGHASFYITG
jgi:hypothetical protein